MFEARFLLSSDETQQYKKKEKGEQAQNSYRQRIKGEEERERVECLKGKENW